ncbi:MAG: hypothetical protein PHQ52_06505 [Candidatus Omnitrophica bacterium]|nr:hypothetical protein [Candidatus Omnitrophota bacterium]
MKNKFLYFHVLISVLILWLSIDVMAAQIYYVGNTQGSENEDSTNKSFSVQKRVDDLLDFSSYGEYGPDRSGRISGNVSEEIDIQRVGGKTESSFYKTGVFQITELNLNIQEKLWDDYSFESQMFLRKSDTSRIEPRKDVRMKQLSMSISNNINRIRFGDFYGELSQFVLGASLEGFEAKARFGKHQEYTGIIARTHEADDTTSSFQRNVFAAKAAYTFNTPLIPLFRLCFQTAFAQDDPATIKNVSTPVAVSNSVFGVEGEIKTVKYLSMVYELAYSTYDANEKSTLENAVNGLALRLQPSLKIEDMNFRYMYYYVTPKFNSVVGSAMPDKEQHQFAVSWDPADWFDVSFTENYYWDHLNGSSRTKRTTNDEKYINFTVKPFSQRKSFSVRPYVNYLRQFSDDPQNIGANETLTVGVSLNDSADQGRINYSLGYEFREFNDEGNGKTGSDIYNRINGGLSFETVLWGRRLYVSDNVSLDIRAPKSTSKDDVSVTNSFSAIYDIYDRWRLSGGINVQQVDGANPGTDLTSTKNFAELMYTIDQRRYTRLSFRMEKNMYRPEDGSQKYTEDRLVIRFSSNF